MNDLVTLPDGTELDHRQAEAVRLRVTTNLTLEELAREAGYASKSSVNTFLRSERGRAGVQHAIRQHLLEGARVGLITMLDLATNARSENVRQLAAADLLDRAGYRASDEPAAHVSTGNREVSININLNQSDTGIVIDEQTVEEIPNQQRLQTQGVGEKLEAVPQ
tara:strand:- start:327 stop:821 length:495 start_codon:yes stop_codon:yes gene_type:complete